MEKSFTILMDTNISEDNEQVRIALYANIGFFIQVAQMLEYNLRKLICYVRSVNEIETGEITTERVQTIYDKYNSYYDNTYFEKYTLGRLLNENKELNLFDEKVYQMFDEINKYRIKIVHMIFQNNVVVDELRSSDKVLEYTNTRLVPMINKTKALNDFVIKTINVYKEDFEEYKKVIIS